MQTQQQAQKPRTEKDHVDAKINKLLESASKAEKLGYALRENSGQVIMEELRSQRDILRLSLETVSMQKLPAPFFEYSKEDLQKMKALRAQLSFIDEFLDKLDDEKLLQVAKEKRLESRAYAKGEPIKPAY